MKKLMLLILLLAGSCLLISCASKMQPPTPVYSSQDASSDIQHILQEGSARNQQLAQRSQTAMPNNLKTALLPALSLDQTKPNAQSDESRFNVAAKDMDASKFFMSLVKGTKYNMVVSPKVTGSITLNLKKVTVEDVLQATQDIYGYQYTKTAYGFRILPRSLETRTYNVNYLDVNRNGTSNTSVSSGQISQRTIESSQNNSSRNTTQSKVSQTSHVKTETESHFWKNLQDTLNAIVGDKDGRKVIVNSQGGIVIVRAYPNDFKEVSKYLDSLQANMTRQVILEAKILEVRLNDQFQAGIDWSLLGLQQMNTHDINGNLKGLSPIFTLGAQFRHAFNATVKMLSTQGNVQTLSNPRIATLNNQMAVIKVGKDEFFITDVSNTSSGTGADTQNTQDVSLTPFFSGISLDVTPQIDADGNVILHIHPSVSSVTDQDKKFKINDKEQNLPLALSEVRESDSIVRAKNGQVIVIGGLMENSSSVQRADTPFLSKAPVVGALFKRSDNSSKKTELVILLRPIVVGNNTWSDQVKKTADDFHNANQSQGNW